METENKIIKFLIETKEEPTIRELADKIKSDYKIVHTAVMRLLKKGILTSKKIGKSTQLKLLNNLSKEVINVEFGRRENLLKDKNLRLMLETIKENIGSVNFILILFGSYAKNNAHKNSDIDIMFIIPNLKLEKNIEQAISILPLKIHNLVFTEEQFREMKDSKKLNVVQEAIKNNIVLFGIEQYYEILK